MPLRSPYYSVKIEGVDVTSWIDSVSVTEDDKQADNIQIAIPDPRMIYADAIFEGSTAEVDLGYAEANQHALMIRATLTKVELSYPDGGVPTLTLQGEDKSIEMGYEEKKLVRRGKTVGAIVRAVAEPYGFAGGVTIGLNPDPKIGAGLVHQDGKTDLAFLQELAQKYFAKCFVELDEQGNEVLYFIPERRVVKLRRPDDLLLQYRMGPRATSSASRRHSRRRTSTGRSRSPTSTRKARRSRARSSRRARSSSGSSTIPVSDSRAAPTATGSTSSTTAARRRRSSSRRSWRSRARASARSSTTRGTSTRRASRSSRASSV